MIVVLRVQLIRVALWKVSRIWHVAKRLPTTNVQFKIISFTIYYEYNQSSSCSCVFSI